MNQLSKPEDRDAYVKATSEDVDERLLSLLSVATAHGKEHLLIKYMPDGYYKDPIGNLWYFIGKRSEHKTMFSSHMDTVHGKLVEAVVPMITDDGIVYGTTPTGLPSVLGADDKVGMYIMLRLLEAKVPGVYCFHVGEECGGIGSSWVAKERPALLNNIDRCIAFDRAGYTDVITEQYDQCCSEEFAKDLAAQINKGMPAMSLFEPDNTGVFTDSANYTDHIAECTNLSVGYFNQHTVNEHFDNYWLEELFIPAILKVEWSELITKRTPGDSDYGYDFNLCTKHGRKEYKDSLKPYNTYGSYGGYGGYSNNDPWSYLTVNSAWGALPSLSPLDDYPSAGLAVIEKALEKQIVAKGSTAFAKDTAQLMQVVQSMEASLATCEEKLNTQAILIANQRSLLGQAEEKLLDCNGKPLFVQ